MNGREGMAAGGPVEDPLGTAAIRAATLGAWLSSPTRLREDANVEEDHARGYYRDRAVVELAQNAADAWLAGADAAGTRLAGPDAVGATPPGGGRGRLLLRLRGSGRDAVLTAANTGAPLTAAGVLALSSMRASAKRHEPGHGTGTVGRFGVGFAAVRALGDEIVIVSGRGGVRFSAARSRELIHAAFADAGTTDPVLDRPAADLPVLRLPFAAAATPGTVPEGYDTAVVVTLRGPREHELVRAMLREVDDALLLALPALEEVRVEVDDEPARVLEDVERRWLRVTAEGELDSTLLSDRPHEERSRTGWSLSWAVPRAGGPLAELLRRPGVLHAPTPTDERCTLPALLVATFPLDPSRRHVAPGPASDAVAATAGPAYARLAQEVASAGGDPLALVPTGLPQGRLDARLHAEALEAMRRTPLLRGVGSGGLVPPELAQAVAGPVGHDPEALAALAGFLPGLVPVPRGTAPRARLLALGVEPRDLADVVETLPTEAPPQRWSTLYDALARHLDEPGVVDALAELPVPLVDGRTVRGPRGLVLPPDHDLPGGGEPAGDAPPLGAGHALGLRLVSPEAAHPVLVRLGALGWDPRALLGSPPVRRAIELAAAGDLADGHPEAVVDAVLALVADALESGADPADLAAACPSLARLPLPADDGQPAPARDLTVPGSWAAGALDAMRSVDAAFAARHGTQVLAAAGVRDTLRVVRLDDVIAAQDLGDAARGAVREAVREVGGDGGGEDGLDGWPDYLDELAERFGPGTYLGETLAVADLDAVADHAWPEVLRLLADDPRLRATLRPVRSGSRTAPSYTAWWLQDLLDAPFAAPGAEMPFLTAAPDLLVRAVGGRPPDRELLAALGAVADLAELDQRGWERLLDAVPVEGSPLALADAVALWRGLAQAVTDGAGLRLSPDRLPVLRRGPDGPSAVVASAGDVLVSDEPMWAQIEDVLPAPAGRARDLADALDVEVLDGAEAVVVAVEAAVADTPPALRRVLPAAPTTYQECDDITVDGEPVEWWVSGSEVLAATSAGLARALSYAAGAWEARGLLEILLADPDRAGDLAAEALWDRR